MSGMEKHSAIAHYFKTGLVVVEVLNGESQDDAWRRHLASHPEDGAASVKIFHYPEPTSPKNKNSDILQVRRRENRV